MSGKSARCAFSQGREPPMRVRSRITALLVSATFVVASDHVSAGGFAILAQSASAIGNAFAGGAVAAEDASTIWYNPAGMIRLEGTHSSIAVHTIKTSFKYQDTESTGAFASPGSGEGGDGGGLPFLPQAYASTNLDKKWRHEGEAAAVAAFTT